MAIGGIKPAFKVRLAFFSEGPARFHQIFLIPMFVELGRKALEVGRDARPHLTHHVHRIDARGWG